jgi:hypothetical protein
MLDSQECLLKMGPQNCPGCLDLAPMTFDWRIVAMASEYPSLAPKKITKGAGRGCPSRRLIMAEFLSFWT